MMLCGMGKYGRVMTQYIGIVYDVIFLLLVLGAAEAGRRRGFASGLVSLIGSVAGIIGGTYGTRVWAGGIYDKYVASHVTDVVADTLEKTGGDLAQAIHALTFLPQSIQQKLIDTVSAASSNAVPQVVNALEPLFLPVIQAVVFLSVWIVVRVLCRMLGRVLRGINAIPLIGGLNRILGFAFGFVSGLLNCWIWSILLWVAANLTGGKLEVPDEDYGIWYVDMMDNPGRYEGVEVSFKALMCHSKKFKGVHCPGRFAMVCCENDMQFLALVCRGEGLDKFKNRDWVELTATVRKENCDAYQGEGPVLYVSSVTAAAKPANEVVSF